MSAVSKTPARRTEYVSFRWTPEERKKIDRLAGKARMTLTEYVTRCALQGLSAGDLDAGSDGLSERMAQLEQRVARLEQYGLE